jgi:hypothetical protein
MKNNHYSLGCAVLLLSSSLWGAESAGTDPWQPLQFLVGDWSGGGSGKPGDANGEFSLRFDLDKRILVRRNHAVSQAKSGSVSSGRHEDLMIIYPQSGVPPFRAEYFDNEGHVIRYLVSVAERKAVFESAAEGTGPRFRLTYELKTDGQLAIEFAMAMPGRSYQPYVSGTARRK